jgi:signal peptidase I
VTALCAALAYWWAIGGTWLTVSTASMGRAAPVGTLLWVQPADIGDIQVGDVITFRTPAEWSSTTGTGSAHEQTYTHRVVAQGPDGTLETKGDVNAAADPWRVQEGDLVGRVTARWWGIGWLVEALPLLVFGGIAWWLLTALLASRRSRAPLRVLGTAVLIAAALYLYNPLFGATQLSFVPLGDPGARATYVGTGVMPVRLEADGASPVLVRAGHERSIVAPHEGDDGRYRVNVVPTIPWQTWVVVASGCLAPAVWSVVVGVDPPPAHRRRQAGGRFSAPSRP